MDAIQLQLVIPFHQPLTAGRDELTRASDEFYAPFLEQVENYPDLRLTFYFGGHLLDFLSKHREDLLMRLRTLYQAGRVEVLSGLFYGGIPALLPESDIRGQLQMGFEYWESLLGEAPAGVWLPELAWNTDVPRLLSETEAQYSFGSASQLMRDEYTHRGLGVVEHGGHATATYLLDDTLSRSLVGSDVDRWVDSVVDRAGGVPVPVISVWVDGERLGREVGTRAWAFERGWLGDFFGALSGGRREIVSVRPVDSFDAVRPVSALKLVHGCADPIEADANASAPVDWPDFTQRFREVDTLARRMLRASEKLRDCVATMQEEGLEDEWGDELATAQRLLFSAQTPDAYWRGRRAGFSDPDIRGATYARIIEAEAKIDLLVQGSDDFIAEEFDDRDGDLVEEVFITTRLLTVWTAPADGGTIRTLDDRLGAVALFDVPPRRFEDHFHRAAEAPFATDLEMEARGPRGLLDPLPRRQHELPLDTDRNDRAGTRDWILDRGTSSAEFFSGSALDLTPEFVDWSELRNEIDEDEDLTYHLDLEATMNLAGVSRRAVDVRKSVRVPIDLPEVHLDFAVRTNEAGTFVYATEIPLRLPGGVLRVDQHEHEPSQSEFHQAKVVEFEGASGTVVRLTFSRPVDLWADSIRTTIKDADGFRGVDQGLVLVVVTEVETSAELSMILRVESEAADPLPAELDEESRPTAEMPVPPVFGDAPSVEPPVAGAEANEEPIEEDDEYEYEEVDGEDDDEEEYEYEYVDEEE